MKPRRHLPFLLAALLLGTLAWFVWGPASAPASQPPLKTLSTAELTQLQLGFNRSADKVRVVALLSPT
ncbi:MAG: hypothetical protein L0099_17340 [Acidobacteria bacterium]|nr:hypothetical protein [Acidobacteriota bacterium]